MVPVVPDTFFNKPKSKREEKPEEYLEWAYYGSNLGDYLQRSNPNLLDNTNQLGL